MLCTGGRKQIFGVRQLTRLLLLQYKAMFIVCSRFLRVSLFSGVRDMVYKKYENARIEDTGRPLESTNVLE